MHTPTSDARVRAIQGWSKAREFNLKNKQFRNHNLTPLKWACPRDTVRRAGMALSTLTGGQVASGVSEYFTVAITDSVNSDVTLTNDQQRLL